MHVHFGVDLLRAEWPESVLCIGTFDGVHLGHQAVIRRAVEDARLKGLPCVLATFDRHPAAILAPHRNPPTIASLQANLNHFNELGVAVACVLTFDQALSRTTAEDFYENVIRGKFRAASIGVGHDFAFGKDRQGTPAWLSERIDTDIVPAFVVDGVRVSSSAIRAAVQQGNLETAARLLGRPFEIPGVVVPGQKVGRTLGYPTANLARSFDQLLPGDGIYAGNCDTRLGTFTAAISIGVRPTVDDCRTIEAFLLDYPGDELYGEAVLLKVQRKLRDPQKFDTLEELKRQMDSDIELVSRVL